MSLADVAIAASAMQASLLWSNLVDLISWFSNQLFYFKIAIYVTGELFRSCERKLLQFIPKMLCLQELFLRTSFDLSPDVISALLHPKARLLSLKIEHHYNRVNAFDSMDQNDCGETDAERSFDALRFLNYIIL